jgi:hypothetical protein
MFRGEDREQLTTSTMSSRETIGHLISNLANQTGSLIRDEFALAKREIEEKVQSVQSVLILIAVGSLLCLIAVLALCAALILGLSKYLEPWLSALIVGGVLGVVAGTVIAFGVNRLKQIRLKPEQTLQTLEENKEWLKEIT